MIIFNSLRCVQSTLTLVLSWLFLYWEPRYPIQNKCLLNPPNSPTHVCVCVGNIMFFGYTVSCNHFLEMVLLICEKCVAQIFLSVLQSYKPYYEIGKPSIEASPSSTLSSTPSSDCFPYSCWFTGTLSPQQTKACPFPCSTLQLSFCHPRGVEHVIQLHTQQNYHPVPLPALLDCTWFPE